MHEKLIIKYGRNYTQKIFKLKKTILPLCRVKLHSRSLLRQFQCQICFWCYSYMDFCLEFVGWVWLNWISLLPFCKWKCIQNVMLHFSCVISIHNSVIIGQDIHIYIHVVPMKVYRLVLPCHITINQIISAKYKIKEMKY